MKGKRGEREKQQPQPEEPLGRKSTKKWHRAELAEPMWAKKLLSKSSLSVAANAQEM